MDYQVYDNVLSKKDLNTMQEVMLGPDFPWYFNNHKVSKNIVFPEDVEIHDYQFTHTFYKNFAPYSQYIELINPLLEYINPSAILRIKANLTTPTKTRIDYGFHTDYDVNKQTFSGKTAVFYLNTNDGLTIFKDGPEINSIENRLLVFDSKLLHTGTSATNIKNRSVINLNYTVWD